MTLASSWFVCVCVLYGPPTGGKLGAHVGSKKEEEEEEDLG